MRVPEGPPSAPLRICVIEDDSRYRASLEALFSRRLAQNALAHIRLVHASPHGSVDLHRLGDVHHDNNIYEGHLTTLHQQRHFIHDDLGGLLRVRDVALRLLTDGRVGNLVQASSSPFIGKRALCKERPV